MPIKGMDDDSTMRCQQAFIRLLADMPLASVRMAEVAAAAGVSRPTLYRHFHSKEQLFRAAVDSMFEQFYDQAEPYLTQYEDSLALALNFLASSVAFQHRPLIETLLRHGDDQLFVSQMRKYFARMLGTLIRHQPERRFRQIDLDLITAMLAGACFYALREWVANGMQQTPHEMARVLAHVFNGQLLALV